MPIFLEDPVMASGFPSTWILCEGKWKKKKKQKKKKRSGIASEQNFANMRALIVYLGLFAQQTTPS